jgi:hypothetical protein
MCGVIGTHNQIPRYLGLRHFDCEWLRLSPACRMYSNITNWNERVSACESVRELYSDIVAKFLHFCKVIMSDDK